MQQIKNIHRIDPEKKCHRQTNPLKDRQTDRQTDRHKDELMNRSDFIGPLQQGNRFDYVFQKFENKILNYLA